MADAAHVFKKKTPTHTYINAEDIAIYIIYSFQVRRYHLRILGAYTYANVC